MSICPTPCVFTMLNTAKLECSQCTSETSLSHYASLGLRLMADVGRECSREVIPRTPKPLVSLHISHSGIAWNIDIRRLTCIGLGEMLK